MEPGSSLQHLQVPIKSMLPHRTSRRFTLIFILPFKPGSPQWSLSLRFPHQNPVYTSAVSIRAAALANLILLDLITRTILGEEYRSLSPSLCSFLHSRYPVPLRPKYSPQHPVLKHPQPTFLPQCKRPSITPIQYIAPINL